MQAIELGSMFIMPEVGGSVGFNIADREEPATPVGGYARLWVGGYHVAISPLFKYNYMIGKNGAKGYTNMQVGGVVGVKIWHFMPYVGASHSSYGGIGLDSAVALNYGVNFKIPVIPMSVGFDASWQNPKSTITSNTINQHQFAITLGLMF